MTTTSKANTSKASASADTKIGSVIELLRRKNGATLDQFVKESLSRLYLQLHHRDRSGQNTPFSMDRRPLAASARIAVADQRLTQR